MSKPSTVGYFKRSALTALEAAKVNIEYMYAFLGGKEDSAYMIFRVTDAKAAALALNTAKVRLVEQEELSEL